MGLKQLANKVYNEAMKTGIGAAAFGSVDTMLSDQWKEFFYCDSLPPEVLMVKGQKRSGKKSVNTKGSDNIITNGSVIVVNPGQCMIIVDQGQIVEVCAVPGEYVYDTSTEPTIFTMDFWGALSEIGKTWAKRVTFGGEVAHDQRIYYFNIKEILNNKFGTPRPVPFRVVYEDIGKNFTVGVRCFGAYSYRLGNPLQFFKNIAANVPESYKASEIDGQLKSDFFNKLQPAFAKISSNVRYDEILLKTDALTAAMKEELNEIWLQERGIELLHINIESVSIDPADEERIKKFEDLSWNRDPANAAAVMVGAQAEALTAAASNANGAAMGLYGMNMAQQVGGISANNLFNIAAQQQAAKDAAAKEAAAAAPAMTGTTWNCACGAVNNGKFCAECGKPMPAPPKADSWKCSCGAENTGKFCAECGKPKPADSDGWTCECGAVNKGKFCAECGKPKPAGAPKYKCDKCGWEPADPFNPPKFCGECGDPFNDDDIVK